MCPLHFNLFCALRPGRLWPSSALPVRQSRRWPSERGQSLSSGERQLIALARAFIVAPRVLVLDEATSNLDPASETRIETALDVPLQGRTTTLIAHRLSTAMRADRIVAVTNGGQ